MSQRDIALALGRSRQWVERCLDLAALPKDEFESLIESEDFSPAKLYYLARLRANKSVLYERTCPHCGALLRLEGQATLTALLEGRENDPKA